MTADEKFDLATKLITEIRDREVLLARILGAWDEAQRVPDPAVRFYRWFASNADPQIRSVLRMEGDRTDG